MTKKAFIVIAGFLPIWCSVLAIVIFTIADPSTLVASPWLFVVAIPACAITFLLVFITLTVHSHVSGDESRKFKISGTVFVCGLVSILISIYFLFIQKQNQESEVRAETQKASDFVEKHASVRLLVGDSPRVSLSSSKVTNSSRPIEYDFRVDGSKTIFAIVSVERSGDATSFSLACTTLLSLGQRDSIKDVCGR